MSCRFWLLIPLVLLLPVAVLSSSRTGSITGTLTDPSGAVVPNALVSVVNQETNAIRETQSNEDGDFTVALLPPGHYRVTAENRVSGAAFITTSIWTSIRRHGLISYSSWVRSPR